MKRIKIAPRNNYKEKVESLGFYFHQDYWKEEAYYSLSSWEVEKIEKASADCYLMFCKTVDHIITNELWEALCIPLELVPAIIRSWEEDDLSLYGRFDFALINGIPKLLEFNADTPTSLLEASIIQWYWKEEVFPGKDQFNSLHEALVQSWKDIHQAYKYDRYHFGYINESQEDVQTVRYLIAAAQEAGLNTAELDISNIDYANGSLYTPDGEPINCMFKLYPWEWMFSESPESCQTDMCWIEPLWKSVMSNKAILPIVYKLYPNSPYILPAYVSKPFEDHCRKPILSREGSNVQLVKNDSILEETGGDYGEEGYIYQELVEIEPQDGMYPVIGSWIIGGESCGIGIRETASRITDNMSLFVPHVIG